MLYLAPSNHPTRSMKPTFQPSSSPSTKPSIEPSSLPSKQPSDHPSLSPSLQPTDGPTNAPSLNPTAAPSTSPSTMPTERPSLPPSDQPSLVPSESPSNFPSASPTSEPSSEPSGAPTWTPTSMPSTNPTDHPSESPTDHPSAQPSVSPSANPTASKAPSSSPTISLAPSLVIATTKISEFTIILTNPTNSPSIDSSVVVDVAETFLDDYLTKSLAKALKYRGIELDLARSKGRRLQKVTTIFCTGEARFNLFESPKSEDIDKHVKEAFSKHKSTFLNMLKQTETAGLQSVLDLKTVQKGHDNKVHNSFNIMHLTVIIVCISIVFIGVAASYIWKKNQENNVRKRLLRVAEYTRQYKGQPQLDDDCFRDITPEPIEISDDNKALERMVMRARHDRAVMNRANELLLQQSDLSQTFNYANREVRFAPNVVSTVYSAILSSEFFNQSTNHYFFLH